VAGKMKIMPADLAVDAEIDLNPIPDAYDIAARLT
jgi:lipoyl-dependent peroxiredoxin